ncbi:MAG: hypothetical protein R3A45_07910 [Bdellovibrionota bacterium]
MNAPNIDIYEGNAVEPSKKILIEKGAAEKILYIDFVPRAITADSYIEMDWKFEGDAKENKLRFKVAAVGSVTIFNAGTTLSADFALNKSADEICQSKLASMPSYVFDYYRYKAAKAFLSTSRKHEISHLIPDKKRNFLVYGYRYNIYDQRRDKDKVFTPAAFKSKFTLLAKNWQQLTDPEIPLENNLARAGVYSGYFWSGSDIHGKFDPENSCNGFTTLEGKGSFGHAALGIKHKQWLSYKDIGHCKGNAQLLCVMY